jgi:hypothetical protein
VDTFLTTLYVTVDDFCQSRAPKSKPGPEASLSASEVITLSIFARWSRFASERDFYRYAETNLRNAFPTLPNRSQFNRLLRSHTQFLEAFVVHLAALLQTRKCPYEALDSSAMPIRDAKRRGAGWLAGYADIGWSNIVWDGMRALACSLRSIALGSLPDSALEPPRPLTSTWRRLSSP